MIGQSGPPWLAELQRGFGAALRTPLDRSTGTLRATPSEYELSTLARIDGDAPARLAVYNRQYWCRLFGVLQGEHPLVTALVGAWTFNDLAASFLLAHPPRSADLARVADGFDQHLAAQPLPDELVPDGGARPLPKAALVQAARVDQAFRRVLAAPEERPLQPSAEAFSRLDRCRLVPSRALTLVTETWPLFEMRHHLPREPVTRARPLPAPHPDGERTWAVCRAPGGHRVVPLARGQAALLRHLQRDTIAGALARLESETPGQDPTALARDVQRWLAAGIELGLWTAITEVEEDS